MINQGIITSQHYRGSVMLHILALLILLTSSAPQTIVRRLYDREDNHNVHGVQTKPGEYPGQLSLQLRGYHYCGASVLNENWTLTSARCVSQQPTTSLSVVAGTIDLDEGGVRHQVKNIVIHENYSDGDFKNDIAVLWVDPPFKINKRRVKPVYLPKRNKNPKTGSKATMVGWDATGHYPAILKKLDIRLIDQNDCKTMYAAHNYTIQDTQICAGLLEEFNGPCYGDSGGPLFVDGEVVGLLSWSFYKQGCSTPDYPLVHTWVSFYREWIAQRTGV